VLRYKMPMFYKKCGKAEKDLLEKGYAFDFCKRTGANKGGTRKVTLKTKTSSGVEYKTEGTLNSAKQNMAGSIEASYKHPSGFHLDKFKVSSDHQFDADVSLNDQAEGVKFTLGVTVQDFDGVGPDEKAAIGIEYTHPLFCASAKIDPVNDMKSEADIMLGYQDFSLGGKFKGAMGGKEGAKTYCVNDYSVALGYSLGADASMSLQATNKFKKYTFGVLHQYSPDMTFAARVKYDATVAKDKRTSDAIQMSAGGVYKLDNETVFQGMLDQQARFTVGYSQFLRPMVKLTSSAVIDMNFVNNASTGKADATKFGCCLDLGDL